MKPALTCGGNRIQQLLWKHFYGCSCVYNLDLSRHLYSENYLQSMVQYVLINLWTDPQSASFIHCSQKRDKASRIKVLTENKEENVTLRFGRTGLRTCCSVSNCLTHCGEHSNSQCRVVFTSIVLLVSSCGLLVQRMGVYIASFVQGCWTWS